MTSQWGFIDNTKADVMVPGYYFDGSWMQPGQFGVCAGEAVMYAESPTALRAWAQSIIDQLPPERHGLAVVTVDTDLQGEWLRTCETLADDDDWEEADIYLMCDLLTELAQGPGWAGWRLAGDVQKIWANIDEETGDLNVGFTLDTGLDIGIGDPLTAEDFAEAQPVDDPRVVRSALLLVAGRLNNAY